MDFVFITDLHLKASHTYRVNYLQEVLDKLRFAIAYCNKTSATLLIGGDIFDKPSVPDIVKNSLFDILSHLNTEAYMVQGNHDMLFNSPDHNLKTSYHTLLSTGLVKSLDDATIDLGDAVITNHFPLSNQGKPQLVLYHGLLTQSPQDKWDFSYNHISQHLTDQVFVLLGHDHTPYPPIEYHTSTIFRPGSFSRTTRDDASHRIPVLLHIRLINGILKYKEVPIQTALDYDKVFIDKMDKVSEKSINESYQEIIDQLKSCGNKDLSFKEALNQVTTPEVVDYINKLLTNY